ncbi:hypothetical protein [Clostridium sp. DL1XJH146]
MNNMSDGKTDGVIIMYCKDGQIYPVALNKDDLEMLDLSLGICLKEIKLINSPLGESVNLFENDGIEVNEHICTGEPPF